MSEERGLSSGTLKNRRWHVGQFLDWLHGRGRRVPDLNLLDLDAYLQLHAKGHSRVTIKIHTCSWTRRAYPATFECSSPRGIAR